MSTRPIPETRGPAPRVGIWQSIPSAVVSRYLTRIGWDWIILDLQHGAMGFETAYDCVRAISEGGSTPLVRVSVGAASEVQRALDIGAHGVVVPMVNSFEEAQIMAAAAKYPPLGGRSMGGDASVHHGPDYADRANRATLLLVQVEHIEAIRDVERTMTIPGVDGCFVGPTDLALSMGLPREGYESDPAHREAMRRTVSACRSAGKLAGCNTYSVGDFREKIEAGFGALTLMSEVELILGAGSELLRSLRCEVERQALRSASGGEE